MFTEQSITHVNTFDGINKEGMTRNRIVSQSRFASLDDDPGDDVSSLPIIKNCSVKANWPMQ